MWFWIKDEWAKAFFETNHFLNSLFDNKNGTGWPDKLCHFMLHFWLVSGLNLILGVNIAVAFLISIFLGILYEWIVDCIITRIGASKFDLFFNIYGAVFGVIFSLLTIKG